MAADGARSGGRGRVVLASGVPVDVLEAPGLPARQWLGLRTRRNEALAWAVATAEVTEVACTPASPRGTVAVPAATRGALVATKLVALRDARRDRRESDTHDLWRLLTSDLDAAAAALRSLTDAPVGLSTWVVEQLDRTIGDGAAGLLDALRGLPGAPATVDEVRAVRDALRTELP